MRRVDSRSALLYEWLRYRVLYVCDKLVIFLLKNTTGVLVFLTHIVYTLQEKEKKRMEEEERKNSKKKYERERENSSFFSLTLLFELLLPFFRENIINLI